MKRLALGLAVFTLGLVAAPRAQACDCQKKQQEQAHKQCDCPGQSCTGPCGGNSDQPKADKPKTDKKRSS